MLNILSTSNISILQTFIDCLNENDAVVILNDTSANALTKAMIEEVLSTSSHLYCLDNEISNDLIRNNGQIEKIDYSRFVTLCCHHRSIQTWY